MRGTKLLESMFVFRICCLFDLDLIWIGQSPHLLSLYPVYHVYHISFLTYGALMHQKDTACRKSDSKPDECVQVLSSEREAIENTWENLV